MARFFLSLLATATAVFALPHNRTSPAHALDHHHRATSGTLATAWYPGWKSSSFPPSSVPWSKYNDMTFSFGLTTPDPATISIDSESAAVLPTFVSQAKKNNVKARLSVGGWSGSEYFSPAMATSGNRAKFLKAVTDIVQKYDLDGIDFDWEYPGKQGAETNIVSGGDSANFLTFLKALRQDSVGKNLVLSASVGITPFAGTDGSPMSDVSAFADVLDHIAIMNYDLWGSWDSTTGPNAPLQDSCASTANQKGSATSAIKAWTNAGFPADKIALAVASYGRGYHVTSGNAVDSSGALKLYVPFDATQTPAGDDGTGLYDFNGLVTAGFLGTDGKAASGKVYTYDSCSKTPYVYDKSTNVMVSYDDPASFAAKGEFIRKNGLAGFAMWQVAGDQGTVLVDAINKAVAA